LHLRLHSGDRTLVTDLCGLAAAFQQTPGHFLTPNTPGTHQVTIISLCCNLITEYPREQQDFDVYRSLTLSSPILFLRTIDLLRR